MNRRSVAAVAAGLVLLAGCGSQQHDSAGSAKSGSHTMTMPDGSKMSDAEMQGMTSSAKDAPTDTASMICGLEIQDAVKSTFLLSARPSSSHTWANQLFRCTYHLAGGPLQMSVKDLSSAGPGQAYFHSLRSRLKGAQDIKGLENLGFPAFETPAGNVVFIKDNKTLWVDATHVAKSALPAGFTRTDAAYGVAAAVVACWSE